MLTITDNKGEIEYVSPSYERTFGVALKEVTGEKVINRIHPEDRALVQARYNSSGKLRDELLIGVCVRNNQNEYVLLEARVVPIVSPAGKVLNYLIVSRDIRDRKKTEELLLLAKPQAAEMERKDLTDILNDVITLSEIYA